ncbi:MULTISPECIES: helix-turn-helix transcriptional regulator [unclassified Microbacterium]|uniref:ArsR/SmtB family transcription factor n=1 Tax=unclassified Microbacterium TaxID=2609290 RepID=UPI0015FEB940|nr:MULTISPECIES: metalloregulator ArsR/SmtB family transcription factor [unclassified Microbacterium]MBT2485915.1 winged helix-turn-helix transcriptional regulator [Microbacterium sp. ISL-108]
MSSQPASKPPVGGALNRGAAEELARTLRAVADPTRLQILSIVLGSADERATVGQLAEALGLRQPTVTHHVRILLDDGFLAREQDGKLGWLSVHPQRRSAVEDFLR